MKKLLVTIAVLLWAIPAQAQTNIVIPASLTCSDGFAIVFASGLPTCAATAGVGTVTNTAFTTGKIPKASGGAALVDSLLSESGAVVTTTGTHNATVAFTLNGTAYPTPSDVARLSVGGTFAEATGVAATKKLCLDGAACQSYFTEGATGNVSVYVGDTRYIQAGAGLAHFQNTDLAVSLAKKICFNVACDTYSSELLAGNFNQYIAGIRYLQITATDGYNIQAQGVVVGAPTGGNKGVGTVNATAVYDDNVLLSDWVFEDAYGAQRTQEPTRDRGPKMARRLFSLAETQKVTQSEKRLPWMPKASEFETERNIGGMMTRLWVGQEQQQLYIFDLESRITALEKGRK